MCALSTHCMTRLAYIRKYTLPENIFLRYVKIKHYQLQNVKRVLSYLKPSKSARMKQDCQILPSLAMNRMKLSTKADY